MTQENTLTDVADLYRTVRKKPHRNPLLHLDRPAPDVHYVEPVLLTVAQTCDLLNCGRTKLFALLATQQLERVKLGRATRISVRSIRKLAGA
jgi:excisionase family DNA binding protein